MTHSHGYGLAVAGLAAAVACATLRAQGVAPPPAPIHPGDVTWSPNPATPPGG